MGIVYYGIACINCRKEPYLASLLTRKCQPHLILEPNAMCEDKSSYAHLLNKARPLRDRFAQDEGVPEVASVFGREEDRRCPDRQIRICRGPPADLGRAAGRHFRRYHPIHNSQPHGVLRLRNLSGHRTHWSISQYALDNLKGPKCSFQQYVKSSCQK